MSDLPSWQTKSFITIKPYLDGVKREGYPFGLEMEAEDGTRELHGAFATPMDAHQYRARLMTAYSGYTSGKLVKIESPAIGATDCTAFEFPSTLITRRRHEPADTASNANESAAEIMIMALDYTGLPRAWAYGPANKRDEISERVRKELRAYCAKQTSEINLADPTKYQLKLEVLARCPHCENKRMLSGGGYLNPTCGASECQEAAYRASGGKRYVGELVELTRDCEIGGAGERAHVTKIDGVDGSMTLDFFGRSDKPGPAREMRTGADYRFIRRVK